jgi:hypothetical protein
MMTSADRDFLLKNLEEGRDAFLRSIAGLSEAQLRFKPSPDCWSIADCIEHIAVSEEAMFASATQGAPNPNGVSLDPEKDARLTAAVVSRSRKVPAPERFHPAARFASAGAARQHFLDVRQRAIAYVRECSDDLRRLFAMHPLLGEIDCHRYLIVLAAHAARHAGQIEEIKNDPAFPKA